MYLPFRTCECPIFAMRALHRHFFPAVYSCFPPFDTYVVTGSAGQR